MSKKTITGILAGSSIQQTSVGKIIAGLGDVVDDIGGANIVGIESASPAQMDQIQLAEERMMQTLTDSVDGIGTESMDAAMISGLMATDPTSAVSMKMTGLANGSKVIQTGTHTGAVVRPEEVSVGIESFSNTEIDRAVQYSAAFNALATSLDEVCDLFFPLIVIAPTDSGINVTVKQITVMQNTAREIDGSVTKFKKRSILKAYRDPSILKNDSTKIVPVHRAESEASFVPVATLAATEVSVDGDTFNTSYLQTGKSIDLLAISQTTESLAKGVSTADDEIDGGANLQSILFSATDGTNTDIISVNVSGLPGSDLTPSVTGSTRVMNLIMDSDALIIGPTTTNADSSALVALADIASDNVNVRVRVSVNGSVNIETGETVVHGNGLSVVSINDSAGADVALDHASVVDIVSRINSASIIGYKLNATRTNKNIRTSGKRITNNNFQESYIVPFVAPVSVPRPIGSSEDTSDVETLISVTKAIMANTGIERLLETVEVMRSYVNVSDSDGNAPGILGIGRHYVTPTFVSDSVAMSDILDSQSSTSRIEDIKSTLINRVADIAYNLYMGSGYSSASKMLNGSSRKKPTIIIATDIVTAMYLQSSTIKTVGGDFPIKVSASEDKRMVGKLIVSFSQDETDNGVVSGLSFGNTLWSPEVVIPVPITRGNSTTKETIVAARYRFIANLPVMGELDVSDITAALGKIAANRHAV